MTYLLTQAWTWISAHPIECAAIILYLLANVLKRPAAAGLTGWRALLWGTLDRLCILTAGRLPGTAKALFGPSPAVESPAAPPDPPKESP